MVAESSLGNIRLNTKNGDYIIFDKASQNTSLKPPFRDFAVSVDGRYVISIYRYSYAENSVKLIDLNNCQGNQQSNEILSCRYVDVKKDLLDVRSPREVELGVFKPIFTDNLTLKFYRAYRENNIYKVDLQLLSVGAPVLYNYLALGDSFSAGEGAYNYRPGTDVVTPLNKCHLSQNSYPLSIGQKLDLSTYNSVACSGAKMKDIFSSDQKNYNEDESQAKAKGTEDFEFEILNNFLPGYRIQQRFVETYLPRSVTISVGGNDIGFGGIIAKCAAIIEDCYSKPRERADLVKLINDQFYPLVETYGRLKSASAGGTINVIGYPQITSEDGNCAINARFSHDELRIATGLINHLNFVIKKAAARAGVIYVEVDDALAGHRLCEGDNKALAVNGLTNGDDKFLDFGPIANESYHPNLLGQKLLENKILDQTNNLTKINPQPDNAVVEPRIEDAADFIGLNIFDFNQPIFDFIDMSAPVWSHGLLSSVKSSGFAPNSQVEAFVTSEPHSLGQFTADNNGAVNFISSLGDETPLGFHTLHLSGMNVAGEEIEQLQQIYLINSLEDFNGDGILNQDEPCLAGQAAGVDVDGDGVDDACDGVIGEPSTDEPRKLPGFETFPDPKPPENNPETVAGNEPQAGTISEVNPSTNQAPQNSQSLQPGASQTQATRGNLQTGGGVQTGGNSAVNNLLNQGPLTNKPLSVGVAGASTSSTTAPAQPPEPSQTNAGFWLGFVMLFLTIIFGAMILVARLKRKTEANSLSISDTDTQDPKIVATPAKPKNSKSKKTRKKPHHH